MDNSEPGVVGSESVEHSAAPAAEHQHVPPQGPVAPQSDYAPPPKRNPAALFFVAAIVAALLFVGFHAARRAGNGSDPLDPTGKPAPDFTLQTLDGKNVTLSSLRGKAVLLNFWATWCGPCKIEMPWFVELQKEYGSQGLQIVGVAMDDSSTQDIQAFGKEAVGQAYGGVDVLPTTFFIDRNGDIVAREFGLQSRSLFVDNIKKAIGGQ
jgi:cytochrome c biogenesis protein CcmG/thiol:disulfide interchange protein DsbE